MGASGEELSGPDLGAGVALGALVDGVPLLGHFGGEPVVLVRRGDAVRAIGARCTHYGGPLAEGLVVGDTLRCPWHHACFDLRTGDATSAPALDPVACYAVRVDAGRVSLTGKRAPSPPPGVTGAGIPGRVGIIGAG